MSLDVSVDDGAAVVTLNRPDVLNSFDDAMGSKLVEAIRVLSEDETVRCIAITGAGRAFSAGEDLGALRESYAAGQTPELGRTLVERYNPLIRAVRGAPKPVVAAVNGVAAGAGASLALACDLRVASERAKLSIAFIKVGLVPDSGAVWFLSKMIGTAATMRLAATGDVIDAAEAHRLGLFDEVVAADDFEDRWRSSVKELARGPTRAFALTKKLVEFAAEHTLDEQLDEEVHAQTAAGRTSDHIEGVTAFFEKRSPSFTGR